MDPSFYLLAKVLVAVSLLNPHCKYEATPSDVVSPQFRYVVTEGFEVLSDKEYCDSLNGIQYPNEQYYSYTLQDFMSSTRAIYEEIKDYPRVEYMYLFPDKDTAYVQVLFGNDYVHSLEQLRVFKPHDKTLETLILDANDRLNTWAILRRVISDGAGPSYRRRELDMLRTELGEHDFNSGIMPTIAPFEIFPEWVVND